MNELPVYVPDPAVWMPLPSETPQTMGGLRARCASYLDKPVIPFVFQYTSLTSKGLSFYDTSRPFIASWITTPRPLSFLLCALEDVSDDLPLVFTTTAFLAYYKPEGCVMYCRPGVEGPPYDDYIRLS